MFLNQEEKKKKNIGGEIERQRMRAILSMVGLLAGTGTCVSFLPQMIRVVRRGDTGDLVLSMFLLHTSGLSLWIVYGILLENPILIAFNSLSLTWNLVILYYFVRPRSLSLPS